MQFSESKLLMVCRVALGVNGAFVKNLWVEVGLT
jgi:hypothetical protein